MDGFVPRGPVLWMKVFLVGPCPSTAPIWVFFAIEKTWGYVFTFEVCYIGDSENLQVYSASVEDFDEVGVGFAFLDGSFFVSVIYLICLEEG